MLHLWDSNRMQLFYDAFHPDWLVYHKVEACVMEEETLKKKYMYYLFLNEKKEFFCFDDEISSCVFSHSKSICHLITCIDNIITCKQTLQVSTQFNLMQVLRAVRMLNITCELPGNIINVPGTLRGVLLFKLLVKDSWSIYRYFFSVEDVKFVEETDAARVRISSEKEILKLANALLLSELNHA